MIRRRLLSSASCAASARRRCRRCLRLAEGSALSSILSICPNPDDRDWLRALIWPDQGARLKRLDRAIEIFMKHKPVIRAGDALELLPDALANVARGQVPCIYHTIAIYQFSREMKQGLEDILTVAGLRQPVWRLGFEYDGTLYVLSAIRYSDGVRQEKRLASAHPHGTWLEWLA